MAIAILMAAVAAVLAGAAGYFYARSAAGSEVSAKDQEVAAARAETASKQAELAARGAELKGRTEQYSAALQEIAERKKQEQAKDLKLGALEVELATLRTERKSDEEKMKELVAAREQMVTQFEVAANKILEEKSKKFTEQNKESLGQLLDPVRVKLAEFQKKVEEVYVDETKGRTQLAEQVRQLMTLNTQLSTEAKNLTQALTNSGKVQGDWGELILERVLEASGLRKDHDYFVQQSFKTEDQKNVRPDVLIKLPEERSLIIDSKMTLVAYNDYANAQDEATKAEALARHLGSVRSHFSGLSAKSYEDLRGLRSPDFVIMFLPLEPAFMLAISSDQKLWEDAYRVGVLLVSPTNLLFVLRTVAQLWKTEDQKRHVDEIAKRGSAMYEKFVGFVEDLQKVGDRIEQAKTSYGDALAKLHTGPGNLVGQAEKMRKLGLKAKKQLPPSLLPEADEEEDEKSDAAGA